MNTLPTDKQQRKEIPIARGVLDYFPLAIAEIAHVSFVGNSQHNGPNSEMFWDKTKSTDHADCAIRHFLERGNIDSDGLRHTAKAAWRILALLQLELEKEAGKPAIEKLKDRACIPTKPKIRRFTYDKMVSSYFEASNGKITFVDRGGCRFSHCETLDVFEDAVKAGNCWELEDK